MEAGVLADGCPPVCLGAIRPHLGIYAYEHTH